MRSSIRYSIVGILCVLITGVSCQKNALNIPEPAKSLEGNYEAKVVNGPFLVNGQTAQLSIKRVTADSVNVTLRAFANGHPSDSLSFGKSLVYQDLTAGTNRSRCIGYRIKLSPIRANDELTMTCSEENVFSYRYALTTNGQQVNYVKFKRL